MRMNRDLAKHVAIVGYKAMGELTDLLELLKGHCDQTEYETYARGVAVIAGEIVRQLLNKTYTDHPDLEAETDAKIKKYGKLI
jgi:hypothetical protein